MRPSCVFLYQQLFLLKFLEQQVFIFHISLRDVFQCSVLLSFWRVRHLWHKNIMKCLETGMQIKISRRLGWIVDNICRLQGTMSLFEDFMEDFIDESSFTDYFKATWHPRMG